MFVFLIPRCRDCAPALCLKRYVRTPALPRLQLQGSRHSGGGDGNSDDDDGGGGGGGGDDDDDDDDDFRYSGWPAGLISGRQSADDHGVGRASPVSPVVHDQTSPWQPVSQNQHFHRITVGVSGCSAALEIAKCASGPSNTARYSMCC